MNTQVTENATVSPVPTVSALDAAYNAVIQAIESKANPLAIARLMGDVAELVGPKPERPENPSKTELAEWKLLMDGWNADRKRLEHVFRKAKDAGYHTVSRYSARGLASGGMTLTHTERMAFRPAGNAWKL